METAAFIPPPAPRLEGSRYLETRLHELEVADSERRIEALRLYRPMPWQEQYHACKAKRRIVIGGNRAGKTLAVCVENSRAVLGCDPYNKYPAKDGNLILVGANWTHFRVTMVPMLFKAGAFRIIRDPVSNLWRAFDPELDAGRENQSKPAPPLIPPRFIKKMNWHNRSLNELASCELITGWTIHCFSSDGVIPMGFRAHRAHVDEDVEQEEWIDELQARTADATGENRAGELIDGGVFDWSAMPHSKNEALLSMAERAEAEAAANLDKPRVVRFKPTFLENKHISANERNETLKDWSARGDEVVRKRAYGEFTMDTIRMYPSFTMSVHGMTREELYRLCKSENQSAEGELAQPPLDWSRWAVIDPGHDTCAVLFAAVPPPRIGTFILCYDELYLHQCNAAIFGHEMARKCAHQTFRGFIIDAHGGRLTDFGSGLRPRDSYSAALRERGVRSELSGCNFLDGCDDIEARADAVRVWLYSADSNPKLRVLQYGCPNLIEEIKRYKKKRARVDGRMVVLDKPETRRACHLVQALEYLAAHDPDYSPPRQNKPKSFAVQRMAEKRKKNAPGYLFLGPQSAITVSPQGVFS